jgi:hypothetical protein
VADVITNRYSHLGFAWVTQKREDEGNAATDIETKNKYPILAGQLKNGRKIGDASGVRRSGLGIKTQHAFFVEELDRPFGVSFALN